MIETAFTPIEQTENHIKTVARVMEFVRDINPKANPPLVLRVEEPNGTAHSIPIDETVIKIWKGVAWGAARELEIDGHEQVIFEMTHKGGEQHGKTT